MVFPTLYLTGLESWDLEHVSMTVQVEAEMAIQEIWSAKKVHEQEKHSPVHLQDFFYLYLVR